MAGRETELGEGLGAAVVAVAVVTNAGVEAGAEEVGGPVGADEARGVDGSVRGAAAVAVGRVGGGSRGVGG